MNKLFFCALLILFVPVVTFSSTCSSLAPGSTGSAVTVLQQFLTTQFSNFSADYVTGYYGPLTENAVAQWQSSHGIVSSGTPQTTGWGIVGPRTTTAMGLCGSMPSSSQQPTMASTVSPLGASTAVATLLAQLEELETQLAALQGQTSPAPDQTPPVPSPGAVCNGNGPCTSVSTPVISAISSPPSTPSQPVSSLSPSPVPPPATVCNGNGGPCTGTSTSVTAVNGCLSWPSVAYPSLSLQDAVNSTSSSCVNISPGTYLLNAGIVIPSEHTLEGAGEGQTILKANPQTWQFGSADSILVFDPSANSVSGIAISGMTLDGSGAATYGIVGKGMNIQNVEIENGRCAGLAISGPGVVLKGSTVENNAQTTTISGRGTFNCASNPNNIPNYGGLALGAGIYGQGSAFDRNWSPDIEGNTIENNIGPGMDINNIDGGTFENNTVAYNSGWAGISLYETTGWNILNNNVSQPSGASIAEYQQYHPTCLGGPNGPHPAAIFLCSDGFALATNAPVPASIGNRIIGNQASSWYGIVLGGSGATSTPSLSPYGNDIENNNIFGSVSVCLDSFYPQWATASTPANTWSDNNCGGPADTPPWYF